MVSPTTPAPKMKPLVPEQGSKADGGARNPPRGEHPKKTERRSTQVLEQDLPPVDNPKAVPMPAGALPDQTKQFNAAGFLTQPAQPQGLFQNQASVAIPPAMLLQPGISVPLNTQLLQLSQQAQINPQVFPNYGAYNLGDHLAWLSNMTQALNTQNPTASFIPGTSQTHPSYSAASSEFTKGNDFAPMANASLNPQPSGLESFYPSLGKTGDPFVGHQVPPLAQTLPSPVVQGPRDSKSFQEATKAYEVLSAQLSRLDRHMALHTWDLDPRSKKLLVEQRMSLVRELDAVRLYKEQLELAFGPLKPGSEESRDSNVSSQNSSGKHSVQMPQSFPSLTASYQPVALAGMLPQMVSASGPFTNAFQWPNYQDPSFFENGLGFEGVNTNSEHSYGTEPPRHNPGGGTVPGPVKRDVPVQVKKPTAPETPSEKPIKHDGWTTTTRSAPPDIARIFTRIEEAGKRGVPIEGLLEELASVTAKLVQQISEQQGESSRPAPKRNSKTTVTADESGPSMAMHKGNRHAIGRLWRSEEPRQVSQTGLAVTYETDEDEGEGTCSSGLSTTDSWATIQEGE